MKALEPEAIELIEQYTKGQVTDKEAQFVRDLLESRPECREYHDFFIHFNKTLNQEPAEPPVWLKRKIMNRISEPHRPSLIAKWAPLTVGAAALLILGILIGSRWNDLQVALTQVFPQGTFIGSLLNH
jgi:anti-sigma factor RsiW